MNESNASSLFEKKIAQLERALKTSNPVERRAALKRYYFPKASAPYEYGLVFVNGTIGLALGILILRELTFSWALLAVALAAFFIADAMSAGFHKWLDSYASEANRLWGSAAEAFRVHHEFPNNLNETTYLHNVSAFAPFVTFLYCLFFGVAYALSAPPLAMLFIWILIVLFSNGTEIHKQAHRKKAPRILRVLQRSGFLLNRNRHQKHHSKHHNSDYGIINGWSNGLFSWLRIWTGLDLALWRTLGVFPRNWIHDPASIPPSVIDHLARDPSRLPREISLYLRIYPHRAQGRLRDLIESLPAESA